jgi:MFS family permease
MKRTSGFLADIKSMFALMSGSQRIALLMVMQGMSVSFVMSTTQLLPVFASHVYHANVGSSVGALRASFGLGGLVGALVITQTGRIRRKARLLLATGAVQGLLLIAFAAADHIGTGLAVIVVLGIFQAVYLTLTSTLFATSVDDAMRGRVMSLYVLATVVQPLIVVPLGSLSDAVGVQLTILLCGALFFVLSVTIAVAFPRFRTTKEVMSAARADAAVAPTQAAVT